MLTRREALGIALGYAARNTTIRASPKPREDAWETKPPSEWNPGEIKRITTDSPWAHAPLVFAVRNVQDRPWSERTPLDFPRADKARGVIGRWESSRAIQDALRATANAEITKYYVINLAGDTWVSHSLRNRKKLPERLHEIARFTKLETPARSILVEHVEEVSRGSSCGILFYFPRRQPITPEEKQVRFVTVVDLFRLEVTFTLKEMHYHGQLAL